MRDHDAELKEAISVGFSEAGFYLHDQDGDVIGVRVDAVEISAISLLEVEKEIARFEVTAIIDYSAEVFYSDLNSAMWDSEDKRHIFIHKVNTEVERSEEQTLTVSVALDGETRFARVVKVKFSQIDFGVTALDDEN